MQNESNWMVASNSGVNLLVQLSMTILMQILRLRNRLTDDTSPLETIIYTQPKQRDTLRIIPVVTSYMSNIFNRRLPVLSCRLLRRFAIEFQMSLLACLDMEADQIRLTFLERLPDELESDFLKIAVIEFVEACINKQPGLTEAFFKIKNVRRYLEKQPKTREIGDGILTYMTDYLETISQDAGKIVSPLAAKIMSLFHALWKKNMQSLVQELIQTPSFWSSMFNPLYGTIRHDIQAYSQLLNILGIELFMCPSIDKMDDNLKKAFEKFFGPDIFKTWIQNIFDLPEETIHDQLVDETPEWLCRLQSFKDFMVVILRKSDSHGITIPDSSKKYFAVQCLDTLIGRAEYTDDLRPFIILSELYLLLLLSFKARYTETSTEDDHMLVQITSLLNRTSISYRDIHVRARESVLTIALKSLDLLTIDLIKNSTIAADFMRSSIKILCFELSEDEQNVSNSNIVDHSNLPFILSINLLKKISLNWPNGENYASNWHIELVANKIINRMLSCLSASLQVYEKRKLSVEMLELLIVLNSCSGEMLHCDIKYYLWLKLLPPKELLQGFNGGASTGTLPNSQMANGKWQTNDWWTIYARGIQLVTGMLQQHGHIFLKDAILFVGVHEEYLMDSILLGKQSMDKEAVELIRTSLLFVYELIQYEKEWRLEHVQSMFNLMVSTFIFPKKFDSTLLLFLFYFSVAFKQCLIMQYRCFIDRKTYNG